MSRASRRSVNKDITDQLQGNFAFLISSLQSSGDIQEFFDDFLTTEERVMLTKRLMLHLMFENDYTSEEIRAVLGLSRDTIRIHKRTWQTGGYTYKKIIRKIARREKTKELWSRIEKLLKPLDLALRAKSNIKARAKLLSGDF